MENAAALTESSGENRTAEPLTMQEISEIVTKTADAPPSEPMPAHYALGPLDICGGRGKSHWNMPGNIVFRQYIQDHVHSYLSLQSKGDKTRFVNQTLRELRDKGYRFLAESKENRWYDIGDAQAKNKIAHSFRDQVTGIRKAMRAQMKKAAPGSTIAFPVSSDDDRKRKADDMSSAEAARRVLQQRAASSIAAAAAATQLKARTSAAMPPVVTSTVDELSLTNTVSLQKPDSQSDDNNIHMAALRTKLTQAIGDLNCERQEKLRIVKENEILRKEAENSRSEVVDLKRQVANLSGVVRELWSQQGGTLNNLKFLNADAIETVARVVGMPNSNGSSQNDRSDDGTENHDDRQAQDQQNHQSEGGDRFKKEASGIGVSDESIDI